MQNPIEKIGFFGGSFDPIHFGHLHLAIELGEAFSLEEIWFCPAWVSPHKIQSPPQAPAEERKKMVSLAIEGIPHFRLIDIEIQRKAPSYTVDTLLQLSQENLEERKRDPKIREKKWYFLLSLEAALHFHQWKDFEKILEIASPLIGSPLEFSKDLFPELPVSALKKFQEGWAKIPKIEISSTEVRKRLKQGKYCSHLLPAKVVDHISFHRLYFSL